MINPDKIIKNIIGTQTTRARPVRRTKSVMRRQPIRRTKYNRRILKQNGSNMYSGEFTYGEDFTPSLEVKIIPKMLKSEYLNFHKGSKNEDIINGINIYNKELNEDNNIYLAFGNTQSEVEDALMKYFAKFLFKTSKFHEYQESDLEEVVGIDVRKIPEYIKYGKQFLEKDKNNSINNFIKDIKSSFKVYHISALGNHKDGDINKKIVSYNISISGLTWNDYIDKKTIDFIKRIANKYFKSYNFNFTPDLINPRTKQVKTAGIYLQNVIIK